MSDQSHNHSNNSHEFSDHTEEDQFDGFSKEELKKNFKHLASELEGGGATLGELVSVAEKRKEETELKEPPYYRGYEPSIKDYLARAKTEEQCEEIIDYCETTGEISESEAERFRERLEKGGPRAFGTRNPGYYDQKL